MKAVHRKTWDAQGDPISKPVEIGMLVSGLASCAVHVFSPLSFALLTVWAAFWSKRVGKTWYGTVGLVGACCCAGMNLFYTGMLIAAYTMKAMGK